MSLFVFFISLPIVAQHVLGNHVPHVGSSERNARQHRQSTGVGSNKCLK